MTLKCSEIALIVDQGVFSFLSSIDMSAFDEPKLIHIDLSHANNQTTNAVTVGSVSSVRDAAAWNALSQQFRHETNTYRKGRLRVILHERITT